jgi:uncharacterized membrane protein YgaE (UPF0421/DUF939 family)
LASIRSADLALRQAASAAARRLPTPLRDPVRRLFLSGIPIVQCSTAAAAAWWVATDLAGHKEAFFAPIAAVVSLGLSLATRVRRVFELLVGVVLGIGVADLLILQIGSGIWQLGLVVALAMSVAVLVDSGPVIAMQAGTSAVLVATLLPPGGSAGFHRMIDALIGGVVGVLVVALIPTHPVRRPRRDAAAVIAVMVEVLRDVAKGLEDSDEERIEDALRRARATQPGIDQLRADLKGGREISRLSPMYWTYRERLGRLAATADPLDAAVRNLRVMARRALTIVRDGERTDPRMVEMLVALADAVEVVRRMILADPGQQPDQAEAARVLRTVARQAQPELLAPGGLSTGVVFAQIRSMLVDLFQICGLSRISALATLPPTTSHPAVPPEEGRR